jgi:hypothetical protein
MQKHTLSPEAHKALSQLYKLLKMYLKEFNNLSSNSKKYSDNIAKSKNAQALISKLEKLDNTPNNQASEKVNKEENKKFEIAVDDYFSSTRKELFDGIEKVNTLLKHFKLNTINLHNEYMEKYSKS